MFPIAHVAVSCVIDEHKVVRVPLPLALTRRSMHIATHYTIGRNLVGRRSRSGRISDGLDPRRGLLGSVVLAWFVAVCH
jgi:hypothetical protein